MVREVLQVSRRGEFSYPICFEQDFASLGEALLKEGLGGKKLCIVTDSRVAPLYLKAVKEALETVCSQVTEFVFPAGEASKNLDTVQDLYQALIEQGLDRKSLLAALGGGVVGDLTGFGAATFLRGIDFIQIPTTLLAQVDSSVGGKTGVDFRQYKNMVGAFHQPRLVYMNMTALKTLPRQEFVCGMGEILKTGLLGDGDFFRLVCREEERIQSLDPEMLSLMVRRCCAIKAGVVERDPKEEGERALLNLGHTVGHAVEKLKNFQLLHGQCVGLGLLSAASISRSRGLLTDEEFGEIKKACKTFGLPDKVEGLTAQEILAATRRDKKMENGRVKFVLMDGIGHGIIDPTVTDQELLAGIGEILP